MDEPTPKKTPSTTEDSSGSFRETVMTIIYAIVIAMGIRTFAFEPFNIPSGSMIPTLLVGDYLFVSKPSYGYSRYSLPLGIPLIPDRILFTEPERGDVAVFRLPTDTSTDYIKRLVGLPGDKIQMIGGVLHINGKPVKRQRVDDYLTKDAYGNVHRTPQYLETLPNGKQHYILEASGDNGFVDNTGVYVVPEGHYFAMGDNRDSSQDSRFSQKVGFIPIENLVGRADFLFFSTEGDAWKIWTWPSLARFSRVFSTIE